MHLLLYGMSILIWLYVTLYYPVECYMGCRPSVYAHEALKSLLNIEYWILNIEYICIIICTYMQA